MNVAVDLGGTFVRCAADDGHTLSHLRRHKISTVFDGTPADEVWDGLIRHIAAYTDEIDRKHGMVDRIIVGFPGPVLDQRIAVCAPTISGDGISFDFASQLRTATGRDVVLLNDVSAAAWYLASRFSYPRFLVVTVSSGIGSKLVLRAPQTAVLDDCLFAGEIGHIVVDRSPDAALCDCGGCGHLGAIASGRGYERAARAAGTQNREAFRRSRASLRGVPPEALTNEDDLVPALRAGDEWAWTQLRPGLDLLARVLVPIIHSAALRNVILIGGFATAIGERYTQELDAAAKRIAAGEMFGVPAESFFEAVPLHEDACLHGAALFGRSRTPLLR